jgi:hypothetical protein
MSFGGLKSTALNSATANAVTAGIFMAVAAGNAAQDANDTSPASEPSAYTVGATDKSDNFASFSNFGPIVDILAPGVDILSTWTANGTVSIYKRYHVDGILNLSYRTSSRVPRWPRHISRALLPTYSDWRAGRLLQNWQLALLRSRLRTLFSA